MRIKKLLSLLLALILCISLFPAALAEEPVGLIAPAEEPDEESVGVITPAEPDAAPEKTGWTVPLWNIPEADEINVTEHTIDVPDVKLEDLTDESVYNAMIAKKADFPEGMHWTNDDYYRWNGGIYGGGYGCAGFAFLLSDAAFGTLPSRMKPVDYNTLRAGDILRIYNDSHSVIVLQVFSDHVVVAEGNYNSSIHWGRTLSRAEVDNSNYVLTRWEGAVDPTSCSMTISIDPDAVCYDQVFTILVTVNDATGEPVMGMVVGVWIYDHDGNLFGSYIDTTDSLGRVKFIDSFQKEEDGIEPGSYTVYAYMNGSNRSINTPFTLLPECLPGDVNGDETVDLLDLVRLRKYLSGEAAEIREDSADLDGDSTVGTQDLVLLRKLLVNAEQ